MTVHFAENGVLSTEAEMSLPQGEPGFAIGKTIAILDRWPDRRVSLALWLRDFPHELVRALDELDLGQVRDLRLCVDADKVEAALAGAIEECGVDDQLAAFFQTDLADLSRRYCRATGAVHVELRFEAVRDDACRLFHLDSYGSRLAVTYAGPGTVFVPQCKANDALRLQSDYTGPLFSMPRFAAGLFAGRGEGREGLVHRSPRIAGSGQDRLFFCISSHQH